MTMTNACVVDLLDDKTDMQDICDQEDSENENYKDDCDSDED